jgi:ssDNA-binding replication factor A large subunit
MKLKKYRVEKDVLVSDATGTSRLTLWESEIRRLEEEKSYKLCGVVVREFKGRKFLSTAKENCKIEDIGVVNDGPEDDLCVTSLLSGDIAKEVYHS